MSQVQDKKNLFLERSRQSLNGADLPMFSNMRKSGEEALSELTPPSTKEEYWKYTRISKILNGEYDLNSKVHQNITGEGDTCGPIEEAKEQMESWSNLDRTNGQFFDAQNAAQFTSGFYADGDGNWVVDEAFESDQTLSQKRNRVLVRTGEKLTIVHRLHGKSEGGFANNLLEGVIEENAQLDYILIQDVAGLNQVSTQYFQQAQNSQLRIHTISLDGGILRNNLNIKVSGENCETYLNGISLGQGNSHIDHHTVVDHEVANCMSSEDYKGIFYDDSRGVFNGKVFVRQDAQKTNAFQSNQNILMSDNATVDSKPELEIYADDVKCSHGSTTGQFDEEAVFYLRSRGIGEMEARTLLVEAFLTEITESIRNEVAREEVKVRLSEKIKG